MDGFKDKENDPEIMKSIDQLERIRAHKDDLIK